MWPRRRRQWASGLAIAGLLEDAAGLFGFAARVLEPAGVTEGLGAPAQVRRQHLALELAVEQREVAQRGGEVARLAPEERGLPVEQGRGVGDVPRRGGG